MSIESPILTRNRPNYYNQPAIAKKPVGVELQKWG